MSTEITPPEWAKWAKWEIGQRVWCITSVTGGYGDEILPQIGEIYTIREMVAGNIKPLFFRLKEIVNARRKYMDFGKIVVDEPAFDATCFKPLKESNIDIFREMCAPVPAKTPKTLELTPRAPIKVDS